MQQEHGRKYIFPKRLFSLLVGQTASGEGGRRGVMYREGRIKTLVGISHGGLDPNHRGHRWLLFIHKGKCPERYTTCTAADLVGNVGIKGHSCPEDCEADSLIILTESSENHTFHYNINHLGKIRGEEAVRIKWDKTLQELQVLYKPTVVLDHDLPDSFFFHCESFVVVLKNHAHAHMKE